MLVLKIERKLTCVNGFYCVVALNNFHNYVPQYLFHIIMCWWYFYLPQHFYHVLQSLAFVVMAVIIMRLKLFGTPALCVLASLLASRQVTVMKLSDYNSTFS